MKKAIVLSLLLAGNVFAETASFTITNLVGALATNLINGPIQLLSLTLYNGNSLDDIAFKFFDSPQTNNPQPSIAMTNTTLVAWSNSASISASSYITNWVRTITNFSGFVTNETRTGLYTYYTTNAGAMVSWPVKYSGTLPAGIGNLLELNPSGNAVFFGRGLTLTNSIATNLVINVTYTPVR